jgi:hypothetical protein
MSLSINKLLGMLEASKDDRQPSNDKLNSSLRPADVPVRYNNLSASEYYASVRGVRVAMPQVPLNGQNINMIDSLPDGQKSFRQDPHGFAEDGSIDPLYKRQRQDPLHAPAPDYYEGQDNIKYGLPKSTMESHDNVGLLQKARASYVNRMNMYNQAPAMRGP